jgi:hypothetical protein
VNKNYRDPYVMSYNVTVQQELGRQFVLNIAYVNNHERQIPAGYNLNADRSALGALNLKRQVCGLRESSTVRAMTIRCNTQHIERLSNA